MNITEFRSQYPQYNDLSDDQLARSLHTKHYSDMGYDDFSKKFLGSAMEPSNQFTEGKPVMASSPEERPVSFTEDFMQQNLEDLGTMAKNAPGSLARTVWGAAKPIAMLGASQIIPEPLKPEAVKEFERSASEAISHPIETGKGIIEGYKEAYGSPEAIRETVITDPASPLLDMSMFYGGTGAVLRGAGALGKAGGLVRAGEALTTAGEAATGAAGRLATAPVTVPAKAYKGATGLIKKGAEAYRANIPESELARNYSNAVRYGMDKGIAPTVVRKYTMEDRARYYKNAESAVSDIVGNKTNLRLTDAEGNIIDNALPETVGQMAEAVQQTKPVIWTEVDNLVKQADGVGIQIPTKAAADTLREFAQKIESLPVGSVSNKGVADYALNLADSLEATGSYSGELAIDELKGLNARLKGSLPNLNEAKKLLVEEIVAQELRKGLDSAVESATGTGTSELRKRYGALKSIEKDVNHRAGVTARAKPVGLAGYVDALGSAEALFGVIRTLSGDPTALMKGLAVKGAAKWIKRMNNPDRAIKQMFTRADELLARRQPPGGTPPVAAPETPAPIPPTSSDSPSRKIPLTWVNPLIERELRAGRMSLRGPQSRDEMIKSLLKNTEIESNKAFDREFEQYAKEQLRKERLKRNNPYAQ